VPKRVVALSHPHVPDTERLTCTGHGLAGSPQIDLFRKDGERTTLSAGDSAAWT
jgi:hypothetical protein